MSSCFSMASGRRERVPGSLHASTRWWSESRGGQAPGTPLGDGGLRVSPPERTVTTARNCPATKNSHGRVCGPRVHTRNKTQTHAVLAPLPPSLSPLPFPPTHTTTTTTTPSFPLSLSWRRPFDQKGSYSGFTDSSFTPKLIFFKIFTCFCVIWKNEQKSFFFQQKKELEKKQQKISKILKCEKNKRTMITKRKNDRKKKKKRKRKEI